MSLRFPRHGAGRYDLVRAGGHDSPEITGARSLLDEPLAIPDRACCCTARPVVKVIMPATRKRPFPVDLWLCGHHWRVSREALSAAGATVHQVATPSGEPQAQRETTAV